MKFPNKKTTILTIVLIISGLFTIVIMNNFKKSNQIELASVSLKENNTSEMFAILLEQTAGTGDYKPSEDNTWPETGYQYNEEKSGCMDASGNKLDGVISYDSNTKIASVDTSNTSYCYLYFDLV